MQDKKNNNNNNNGGGGDDDDNDNTGIKDEDGEEQQQPFDDDEDETLEMELPTHATGKATTRLPDMSMTPRSSSLLLDEPTMTLKGGRELQHTFEQSTTAAASRKTKDPLLHRLLDKNYRLQATPHKGAPLLLPPPSRRGGLSPEKDKDNTRDRTRRALWADSPTSSPEMTVPKLRSDLYMSPAKARGGRRGVRPGGGGGGGNNEPPRTPGVSVQTPATARKTRDVFAEEREREREKGKGKAKTKKDPDEITWDTDSDEDTEGGGGLFGGMSPPKTIQFAVPPSKLMQTPGKFFLTVFLSFSPSSTLLCCCWKKRQVTDVLGDYVAREASKRIVEDILLTAGAAPEESSEYSPTMVKMNQDILDDTF